jgi:hypothetical protein
MLQRLGRDRGQPEPEPEEGPLFVVENHPGPGATLLLQGAGCRPGTTVTIRLDGRPLGTTSAGAYGSSVADLTLPATLGRGPHDLDATCTGPDGHQLRIGTAGGPAGRLFANIR